MLKSYFRVPLCLFLCITLCAVISSKTTGDWKMAYSTLKPLLSYWCWHDAGVHSTKPCFPLFILVLTVPRKPQIFPSLIESIQITPRVMQWMGSCKCMWRIPLWIALYVEDTLQEFTTSKKIYKYLISNVITHSDSR